MTEETSILNPGPAGVGLRQNRLVHPTNENFDVRNSQQRFERWWAFAESQKLHETEFLLPTAVVQSDIRQFTYETDANVIKSDVQLAAELTTLGDWAYQMEFKDRSSSTLGNRHEREWVFHRYRGSVLVRSVMNVLQERANDLSLLDVACHCGPFALEYAYLGMGSVTGIDLRGANVAQARWLGETYGVKNVAFIQDNVRNVANYPRHDVIFCGGLLYHVTFPVELMLDLHKCCNEFIVFDTAAAKDPLSAFILVLHKDTNYSAEGESSFEFQPTYRAVVDLLMSVGFEFVIEIVGTRSSEVWGYQEGITRSFIAFKKGSKYTSLFRREMRV
jgi:2-polyprenyl-3-methyl-5-hydroxy-6-metoxy-1,4-benzoquinol methylase